MSQSARRSDALRSASCAPVAGASSLARSRCRTPASIPSLVGWRASWARPTRTCSRRWRQSTPRRTTPRRSSRRGACRPLSAPPMHASRRVVQQQTARCVAQQLWRPDDVCSRVGVRGRRGRRARGLRALARRGGREAARSQQVPAQDATVCAGGEGQADQCAAQGGEPAGARARGDHRRQPVHRPGSPQPFVHGLATLRGSPRQPHADRGAHS